MTTGHLPPRLVCLYLISLATACGCQGSVGNYVDGLIAKPGQWASGLTSSSTLATKRPVDRSANEEAPPAVLTDQNYASVQLAMGESYEKDGNLESAEAAYHAAVRNSPDFSRAHHRLALVKEKAGKVSESQVHLSMAAELEPNNAEIACDMGYWCYLRSDWDRAEFFFKRALDLDPSLSRAANNLGLVYARTDRPDEAMQLFAAAGLDVAEARTNLGFVLLTENRLADARFQFELALAADPGASKAQHALAALQSAQQHSTRIASLAHDTPRATAEMPALYVPDRAAATAVMENGTYADLPMPSARRGPAKDYGESKVIVVDDTDDVGGTVTTSERAAGPSSTPSWQSIQLLTAVSPARNGEEVLERRPVHGEVIRNSSGPEKYRTSPDTESFAQEADIVFGFAAPN